MSSSFGTTSIPVWLLEDEHTSPAAKLVYLALVTFIDRDRQCFPSHRKLARRSALSVATVKRALDELRASGYVDWSRRTVPGRGQTANFYTLALV